MQKTKPHLMIPMFHSYLEQFSADDPQAVIGRQGRIFMEICKPKKVTRKQLAEDFNLRPGTVSALALQLINRGLVKESRPSPPYQKGRPEILLRPVVSHLGVIVFYVVSQSLHASLVDFGGNILCTKIEEIKDTQFEKVGGERFSELLLRMIDDIRTEAPGNTEIVGVSFSLPGVVDEMNKCWVYSLSRWKQASNMNFSEISKITGLRVILNKNINCELRARIARLKEKADKSILLIHWGHGIGASCSLNGNILTSDIGGFGEVGHSYVHCDQQVRCRCGLNNCLETQAALWALWPEIQLQYPNAPYDEWGFENFLNKTPNFDVNILKTAIQKMAVTIRNLSLILAPQHVTLTGPFTQNHAIFERLCHEFRALLPPNSNQAAHNQVTLSASRAGIKDEIIGAAYPLFAMSLQELQ
jgi:transcriptional regulator of PTS gene